MRAAWRRRRRVVAGGLILPLDFLESPDAIEDVQVDGGTKGEFDGRADERDFPARDRGVGRDEFVHDGYGHGAALLKKQGGVGEGFFAVLAQFVLEIVVLAEPAAQGTLSDVGLAGGGSDAAGGEHGADGAFLAWGESVTEGIGMRSFHILRLPGGWREIQGVFF